MNRVLIIEREFPLQSRNKRILNSLENSGFNVQKCLWNRTKKKIQIDENSFVFHRFLKRSSILNKAIGFFLFYKFIKNLLSTEQFNIVIISHWTLIIFFPFFFKNKIKLIYEVLDIPSGFNKISFEVCRIFEKIALRNIDAVIIASRFYEKYYRGENVICLENKPPISCFKKTNTYSVDKIKFAFIGALRYFPILKNLVIAVSKIPNIELTFYGSGNCDNELITLVTERNIGNVKFEGAFKYENINEIYTKCNLVWASYPSKSINVKYAISNKFHESIAYKVPCIYSKDTLLGEYVKNKNIGFTVDPYSVRSIVSLLTKILDNKAELMNVHNNLLKIVDQVFWEDQEHLLISSLSQLIEK